MKIIFYSSLIILFVFSSCSDFLDVAPRNSQSEDTFWKTEDDAVQASSGMYASLADMMDEKYYITYDVYSDNATAPWPQASYINVGTGNYDASNGDVYLHWRQVWQTVRIANLVLTNIDFPEMDEDIRQRIKGEARFIRAYSYHLLFMLWGDVPIIERPLELSELKIPRDPVNDVTAFVLNDLDTAIAYLHKQCDSENLGRATKGAALALKARVQLYTKDYTGAANSASQVMGMGYQLFYDPENKKQSYETLFDKVNENSPEVVFDIQLAGQLNGYNSNFYQMVNLPPSMSGWGGLSPYQQLVDAFECTDGLTIDKSPLYDPTNQFENRDPRLEMSIIHTGSVYRGNTFNMFRGQNSPGRANASRTGYYTRKTLDESFPYGQGIDYWDVNFMLIRYAEVLLTYAEAKIEANQIDQSVLDAINAVRARAYGVEVNETDSFPNIETTDQTELRKIVRRERRIELCLEGFRIFDIRRWKIAEDVLNGWALGHAEVENGVDNIKVEELTFDPDKNYLLPIPQGEIDLIGRDIFKQNPNW